MVVGLRVDLRVSACGSQWVSAVIRTTNCLKSFGVAWVVAIRSSS